MFIHFFFITFFFFNDTATTEIYTLSLHDALPIWSTRDPIRTPSLRWSTGCWTRTRGRYLQLLGNHEDQYLGGQRFYEHTPLAGGTIATLRRWRASGRLRVAAA